MRASVLTDIGTLELRELERPSPGVDEVVVEVETCGVCMTDYHMYIGSFPASLPLVLGHESVGSVADVGANVVNVEPGDRVAISPAVPCHTCTWCKAGKTNLCDNLLAIGAAGDRIEDGAFAEYVRIPAKSVEPIGDLPAEIAAFSEPLACCVHGVDRVHPETGDSVALIGAGQIGLLLLQVLRLNGASEIIVSEPIPERRELARSLGADHVIDPDETDPVAWVDEQTGGVDIAIEAVGTITTIQQAWSMATKGGTALVFGVPEQQETMEIRPFEIFYHEIDLIGSFASTPGTMETAVKLLKQERVEVLPLITEEFVLEDLPKALELLGESHGLKKLIYPNEPPQ